MNIYFSCFALFPKHLKPVEFLYIENGLLNGGSLGELAVEPLVCTRVPKKFPKSIRNAVILTYHGIYFFITIHNISKK